MKKVYKDRIEYRNEQGQFHRLDGPAIEHINGDKWWFINGKRHREDGPAIEWNTGDKEYYLNGKCHREDGPAIEYSDGSKYWYLNDILYLEDQFNQEVIKLKLNRIKEL